MVITADGPVPKVLLADKGYDTDAIRQHAKQHKITAIIPMKRNRKLVVEVDRAIYALRNLIERCFNKLKNARRLATRYDKTAASYLGSCILLPAACGYVSLSTGPSILVKL